MAYYYCYYYNNTVQYTVWHIYNGYRAETITNNSVVCLYTCVCVQ